MRTLDKRFRMSQNEKMKHVYIGVIPGIFGYGISVASDSKEEVMLALRKAYDDWKLVRPNPETNFDSAFEDWGGRVEKVEFGKTYYDDFNS